MLVKLMLNGTLFSTHAMVGTRILLRSSHQCWDVKMLITTESTVSTEQEEIREIRLCPFLRPLHPFSVSSVRSVVKNEKTFVVGNEMILASHHWVNDPPFGCSHGMS